jgi:hypothetical protein
MRVFRVCVLVFLACAAGLSAQEKPAPPKPVNIAGKWTMTLELEIGTSTPAIEFKQDGEKLTGTYTSTRYGAFELHGTIPADRKLAFTVNLDAEGQAVTMSFTGEVLADGTAMGGKVDIEGLGEGSWSAKRAPK